MINRRAVEHVIATGLAIEAAIPERTQWDRKSYFYPDLPKNYQISQYQLPLCFDGAVDLPPVAEGGKIDWEAAVTDASAGAGGLHKPGPGGGGKRIGIIRTHLEEDAGKLPARGSPR